MAGTIEVRIRLGEFSEPVRLTEWDITDLEGLIRELDGWGYVTPEGATVDGGAFGQIAVSGGRAYFDVVVPNETE